jgi:hypothetical protein
MSTEQLYLLVPLPPPHGIPNAVGEQPIEIGKVWIAVDEEAKPRSGGELLTALRTPEGVTIPGNTLAEASGAQNQIACPSAPVVCRPAFSLPFDDSRRNATIPHRRMGTPRNAPTGPHIQVQIATARKTRNGLIVSR